MLLHEASMEEWKVQTWCREQMYSSLKLLVRLSLDIETRSGSEVEG